MIFRLAVLLVLVQTFGSEGRTYGPPKPTVPPKAGVCPHRSTWHSGGRQRCTHDANCPGVQKCCVARNGQRYCVPLEHPHPGGPTGFGDPLSRELKRLGFDETLPRELQIDVPSNIPTFLDAQPVGPGLVAPQPQPIPVDPFGVNPRPGVLDPRPGVLDPRPDILDPRPDIIDPRPDIFDPRPDIIDPRPDIFDPRPDIIDPRPDIFNPVVDPVVKKPVYGNKSPVSDPGYVDPIINKPGYVGSKSPVHKPGYIDPVIKKPGYGGSKNPVHGPGYVDPVIDKPGLGYVDPVVKKPGYGGKKSPIQGPGYVDPVIKKPAYGGKKNPVHGPGYVDPVVKKPVRGPGYVDPVVKKPGYGAGGHAGTGPIGAVDPILSHPRSEVFNPSCPRPAAVKIIARMTNAIQQDTCSSDAHCAVREICCNDGMGGVCIIQSSRGARRRSRPTGSIMPSILGRKPGDCPVPETYVTNCRQVRECYDDNDCAGPMKCCSSRCRGSTRCMNPDSNRAYGR